MNLVLPAKHPAASEFEAFHSEQKSLTSLTVSLHFFCMIECIFPFFLFIIMHFFPFIIMQFFPFIIMRFFPFIIMQFFPFIIMQFFVPGG